MKQKAALRLMCYSALFFSVSSCVKSSDSLDLNKDISLDMRLASDGISIPLGSLEKIYLDSIIDTGDGSDNTISKLDNGVFCITMDGEIDEVSVSIDPVRVEIDNPEFEPINTDFDVPTPDDITIDTVSVGSSFEMTAVDMASINKALPVIEVGQDNKPVKVEGIPTSLPFTYLSNEYMLDLTGMEKDIEINTDGTLKDFKYDLSSYGLGVVNVPGTVYTIGRATAEVEIPVAKTSCDFVYDSFPTDVSEINTIYFGKSEKGQLLEFVINMGSVDSILYAPEYVISSLSVTFPDGFTLAKDPACKYEYSVSGNSLTMQNVKIRSAQDPLDLSNTTRIPLSVYLSSLELNQGPDAPGSGTMTYNGDIEYKAVMTVSGIPHIIGEKDLYSNMSLATKLEMKDISVDTRVKTVDLADGKVTSDFEVSGLEDVSRVNSITFSEEGTEFFIGISELDIAPFVLDNANSDIFMLFDRRFQFDDTYCKDQNSKTVGVWSMEDGCQKLTLGTDAIGKNIRLKLKKMTLDQNVTNGKMNLSTDVKYSATLSIASRQNLSLSDLSNLNTKDCMISAWGTLAVKNAEVVSSVIKTSVSDSAVIDIDAKVDDALISVSELALQEPAKLDIKLKFKGVPATVQEIVLEDFKVTFPDMLSVSYTGKDSRISLSGQNLFIDGSITKSELADNGSGFVIDGLAIEGIAFSENPMHTAADGNHLTLNGQKVLISGDAVVSNQTVSSSDLKEVTVSPYVSIDPLVIKTVKGKVNPVIDGVSETVAVGLDDDLDFLKDRDNSLGLNNPELSLNMVTTLPVPVCLDIAMSSILDGSVLVGNVTPDNGTVVIPACPDNMSSRQVTLLFYSQERNIPDQSDTIFVRLGRFGELLSTIPDSICFAIDAYAEHENEYVIDITKEFSVKGDYRVNVPLEFTGMNICYSDTIDGLLEDLEDVCDITGDMSDVKCNIKADVESTIPLELAVSAVVMDKNGNAIEGAGVSSFTVKAGNINAPVTSNLEISLNLKAGALAKVDAVSFKIACRSGEDPACLDASEYVQLKNIELEIPEGLDVDFSDK